MDRRGWIYFVMFLAGLFLLLGAAFAGFTAVEYEYEHRTTTTEIADIEDEIGQYGATDVGEFTDGERVLIEDVVAGETIVVDDDSDIATRFGSTVVVNDGEEYHVIERSTVLDWSSPGGIGTVVLAVLGLALIVDSIRRHHF